MLKTLSYIERTAAAVLVIFVQTLTAMAYSVPVSSNAAGYEEPIRYLCIWDNDGGRISCLLADRPRIITDVENSVIKCITSKTEVSFPIDDVHKYTLESAGDIVLSADDEISAEGSLKNYSDNIELSGYEPFSDIKVYNAMGAVVALYKTDGDGCLNILTGGWPCGVYIIKAGSVAYKITKK